MLEYAEIFACTLDRFFTLGEKAPSGTKVTMYPAFVLCLNPRSLS
ncbi:hypothetical protein METH109765_18000 [Mesobacillus thioparans]